MPLPAATFDPTKEVVGRSSILDFTINAVHTLLLVEFISHDPGLELSRASAPGANNGPSFTSKVWEKSRAEKLKARSREIQKVNAFLGSLSGIKKGTCTAYIRDPDDAANTVAEKTDDFACAIYRDPAEASFSADGPAEVTLIIESMKDGPITWTDDAAIV